jgi:hypothetical protein
MRKTLLLLILLMFFWTGISNAQQIRQLPANGKRGTTGERLPWPLVVIGRDKLQLAAGGVIYDTDNRTIVQGSLPVNADVWYQLTSDGQIQRIYILRPDEQSRLDQAGK